MKNKTQHRNMSIIGKGTYKKRPASAFLSEDPMRIRMNTKARSKTRKKHQHDESQENFCIFDLK